MARDRASNEGILAARVRSAREEESWTLQDLAKRSGVAVSTIQKIETGQMVPTLSVLSKVAKGLRRRVSFLIGEDTADVEISYRPARDRLSVEARNQVRIESLAGELRDPEFDAYEFFIPPGRDSGPDMVTHRGDELVVCLQGRIELEVGDRVFDLRVGDSVHYKSIAPHRWRNVGRGEARLILVHSSHRAQTTPAALHAVARRGATPGDARTPAPDEGTESRVTVRKEAGRRF
jgi:transcriptional regulator with XRE-family HTH domain